jgi:hypothetical protein
VSIGDPVDTDAGTSNATAVDSVSATGASTAADTSATTQDTAGTTTAAGTSPTTDGGTTDGGTTDGELSTGQGDTGDPVDPPTGASVLYVNFEGAMLTEGGMDDATADVTQIEGFDGFYTPFAASEGQLGLILDDLDEILSPFDVLVTDDRPAQGDYTMIVVSPTQPVPNVTSVAPIDCDDANPRSVGFVLLPPASASQFVAALIAREFAGTLGLERVTATDDIMSQLGPNDVAYFEDQCHPLAVFPSQCPGQHANHCPTDAQNSAAELEALLGAP